ncbi:MAG: phosphatase PAP2 family protein [Actinomycetota bacterium]|nr:phosphatase PAP2 family protein [Actinomycetota bacterium]
MRVRADDRVAEASARVRLPSRPLLIIVAVVALVVCWAAAIHLREASSIPGARFDAAWAVRINAHHTHFRDVVAKAIALVGGAPGGVLVDFGVAALVLLLRGRAAFLTMLAALGVNEADVLALKWVSERHPPGSTGLYLGFLGSFPSGHTANAAVIVVSVGLLANRLLVWGGGAGYVAVMGLDRTYLDAHWVTDTIAGGVAGAAIAALIWCVARPRVTRRRAVLTPAHDPRPPSVEPGR